jgi:hypothetical protein
MVASPRFIISLCGKPMSQDGPGGKHAGAPSRDRAQHLGGYFVKGRDEAPRRSMMNRRVANGEVLQRWR